MPRFSPARLLCAVLIVSFLIAEVYLVAYVRRTKAQVNEACRRAEAAAQRAEAALRPSAAKP